MRKYSLLILLFPLFLVPFSVSAQVRDTDISLQISPAYPAPNQDVTATLSSQSADLDKTLISWSLNGQERLTGIGKKEFDFNTGDLGTSENISAIVYTVDGNSITKNLSVQPAQVDMLWESPDSYVPPFYRGKALAPSQGTIKVVAVPFLSSGGGKADPANLAYAWTKDGKGQTDSSGWGKDYFTFQNSYLDDGNAISVQVSDILGNATAGGSINLKTYAPKIVFYPRDPVFGTQWGEALSDGFSVPSGGETMVAAPYFFSETDPNSSSLSYTWTLTGEPIDTPDPKNILSVKPAAGTSGAADIKVSINNANTLFQNASGELNVNF